MAKKKQVKDQEIAEIGTSLSEQGLKVLFSYTHMPVADSETLKMKFREKGYGFKVVKKTLLQRALKDGGFSEEEIGMLTKDLKDTSAVGWGIDELGPTKVLHDFAKTNPNVRMKMGFWERAVFDAGQLVELAKTPSREELYGKLVSVMVGPMRNFVGVLSGVQRQFVQVLSAIANK